MNITPKYLWTQIFILMNQIFLSLSHLNNQWRNPKLLDASTMQAFGGGKLCVLWKWFPYTFLVPPHFTWETAGCHCAISDKGSDTIHYCSSSDSLLLAVCISHCLIQLSQGKWSFINIKASLVSVQKSLWKYSPKLFLEIFAS